MGRVKGAARWTQFFQDQARIFKTLAWDGDMLPLKGDNQVYSDGQKLASAPPPG